MNVLKGLEILAFSQGLFEQALTNALLNLASLRSAAQMLRYTLKYKSKLVSAFNRLKTTLQSLSTSFGNTLEVKILINSVIKILVLTINPPVTTSSSRVLRAHTRSSFRFVVGWSESVNSSNAPSSNASNSPKRSLVAHYLTAQI